MKSLHLYKTRRHNKNKNNYSRRHHHSETETAINNKQQQNQHVRRMNTPVSSSSSSMPMSGAMSDDYAAQVVVDGVTLNVNIDTGSVAFAVAGSPDIGCDRYVNTTDLISRGLCDTTDPYKVTYGTGWWSGYSCNMTVEFGGGDSGAGLQLSNYLGNVMLDDRQMTTCARTPADDPTSFAFREKQGVFMEGIAGFAFPDPNNPHSNPILTQLFFEDHTEIPSVFGMQCCGYDPIFGEGGDGALDLGGFDPHHYEGDIQWTLVVEPRYWGVHMTAVRLSSPATSEQNKNLLPYNQTTRLDEHGHARTVVDSGTSMALFDPDTFSSIVDTLRSSFSDARVLPDSFYKGERCVTIDQIDVAKWPPLIMEFVPESTTGGDDDEDPVVVSIPACRYVELVPPGFCVGDNAPQTPSDFPHTEPAYLFALGSMPPGQDALLGQVLFEQYYVAHDMTPGKERIGFAPLAGCASSTLCTDGYAAPGVQRQYTRYSIYSPQQGYMMRFVGASSLLVAIVVVFLVVFFRRRKKDRASYTQIMDH
jgi:Eukaryotic aspartyl protease